MPQVLSEIDGQTAIIFNARDFEERIEEEMGYEASKFYHEQIEQLSDCIRLLVEYVDDSTIREEMEEVLSINGY